MKESTYKELLQQVKQLVVDKSEGDLEKPEDLSIVLIVMDEEKAVVASEVAPRFIPQMLSALQDIGERLEERIDHELSDMIKEKVSEMMKDIIDQAINKSKRGTEH